MAIRNAASGQNEVFMATKKARQIIKKKFFLRLSEDCQSKKSGELKFQRKQR